MPRKRAGLGKGLDALIPGGWESEGAGGVQQVPVEHIQPNPRQPRAALEAKALQELAASIKKHGVLQPLIVTREADGRYTLIAGERRWQAARLAGLKEVPVIVREASEQERLELALIENVQRADLSPLETAEAYRQLHEEFGLTHEEIARRVGKSRVSVTNTLRLLQLPPAVQSALAAGEISEGHARALLGLSTPQAQTAVLHTILNKGLNVRQTEELVRKLTGTRPTKPAPAAPPPEIQALEERLQAALGTRVRLKHGKKGGTVTIHYYSDEELDALIARLTGET